jgi:hypothetical protein
MRKYEHVFKNNWAFYLTLHLVPFLLFRSGKLRNKTPKERVEFFLQMGKSYLGSLLFMGSFVAILKAHCCGYCQGKTFSFSNY